MGKKEKFRNLPPREKMRRFKRHLGTYLVMSLFFFVLNAVTSFGHWWFYWPMLGWGLGVALQGMEAYQSRNDPEPFDRVDLDSFDRRREATPEPRAAPPGRRPYREEDLV